MLIVLTALFLILLFVLPFLPGIVEWIRKRDAEPLFIPMEYIRNPRYFGNSFRRIMKNANTGSEADPGIRTLTLSKEEEVEIMRSVHFGENLSTNRLIYVIGDLTSEGNVLFNKEVYATGNVVTGKDNVIHSIAGDGDITLGDGTKCRRWLDAEGTIRTGVNCRLGVSVSSGDKVFLGKNCLFHRLFGMPIATGREETVAAHTAHAPLPPQKLLSNGLTFRPMNDRNIASGAVVNENVVFLNDVEVGPGARFKGSIKSHGTLILKDDVVVEGNIFSDGDIIVGRNAAIYGHVFSQKTVRIAGQSVISCSNKIKSVVGKKAVFLEPDVTIYGFLTTEGEGKTIEQESCG